MDEIGIKNTLFLKAFRVVLLATVIITAYDTGQAVIAFVRRVSHPDMDVFLVFLWLLSDPLMLVSAFCLFYAYKRMSEGATVQLPVTIGFGSMVLGSVANLISKGTTINNRGAEIDNPLYGISLVILYCLILVCYIIIFLYYQNIGPKILAIFAGGMGLLCGAYLLLNGFLLVISEPDQFIGYFFSNYLASCAIAASSMLFLLTADFGPVIEDVTPPDNLPDATEDYNDSDDMGID